jgi:predicted DNA-binding transcriptional regulator YafY
VSRPSRAERRKAARQARHSAARDWIASGAKKVNVRTYARRFGVDRYTAYQDLRAIGFPLSPESERWAVRPRKRPERRQPPQAPDVELLEWAVVGTQRILVMGYTSGGMPYGLTEDECEALFDW